MALTLSRVDRVLHTIDPAKLSAAGLTITGVTVALLPKGATPTAATVWSALTSYTAPTTAKVWIAGPDASSTGALVATADADLWALVTDGTQTQAVKIERIAVEGSSGTVATLLPLPQVLSVNGKTGALSLNYSDVGAAATTDPRLSDARAATDSSVAALVPGPSATTAALRAASVALLRDAAPIASTNAEITNTYSQRIVLMDSNGRLLRSGGTSANVVQRSTDGGITWADVVTVPRLIDGVRQLDNGELLIGVGDDYPANTVKAALYVTSGYAAGGTVTVSHVLDADDYQQSLGLGWGFGGSGSIYAVSEYDSKAPGSRSATQKVWLTTDSFATTSVIYDHGNGSLSSRHVHGAVYDPYRDAVWITLGDYTGDASGDRRIRVSWDRGSTWNDVSTNHQPTTIHPFPQCVIFGQDSPPNGVLRIDRPSATSLRVDVAYKVSEFIDPVTHQPGLSHVSEPPFQAAFAGAPLLMPFSVSTTGFQGLVLSTADGFTFQEVWRSPAAYNTSGYGPKLAVGPTPDGQILIQGQSGSTFWHTTAPGPVAGITSSVAALGATLTRLIPRRAFRQIANQSSPTYQSIPTGGVLTELLLSTALPVYVDDIGELFVPSPDGYGVTVARDAIVAVSMDSGFSASSQRVVIRLDGVDAVNLGASSIPLTEMHIRAGQKLTTWTSHFAASAVTVYGTSNALVLSAWETY